MKKAALYGRDFVEEGVYHLQVLSPHLLIAISRGYSVPFVTKTDPNEDAVFACEVESFVCLAVADAHWGESSSRMAISLLEKHLCVWSVLPSQEEVNQLFYEIERTCAHSGSDSETSFLLAFVDKKSSHLFLYHCGDAVAILFRQGAGEKISEDTLGWLGPRSFRNRPYMSEEEAREHYGPWQGENKLYHKDVILLCSDGLTQPIYGVNSFSLEEMALLLEKSCHLEEFGHLLMKEALRRDRSWGGSQNRGGEDNISFVLYQVEVA